MVQKHIARIHQIVYYEEMHRGILGLYNDLTIWTTKLFREMLGKIKADTTLLPGTTAKLARLGTWQVATLAKNH